MESKNYILSFLVLFCTSINCLSQNYYRFLGNSLDQFSYNQIRDYSSSSGMSIEEYCKKYDIFKNPSTIYVVGSNDPLFEIYGIKYDNGLIEIPFNDGLNNYNYRMFSFNKYGENSGRIDIYVGFSKKNAISRIQKQKDKFYEYHENKENKEQKFIIGGLDIRDVNLFDLKEMINVFLMDCKSNEINISENIIEASFSELPDQVIAYAFAKDDDSKIKVVADPKNWKFAIPQKKWYILYHELGHDVLNLNHGEGGKMMFNYSEKSYTWEDFFTDKDYMFSSFKKNYQKKTDSSWLDSIIN